MTKYRKYLWMLELSLNMCLSARQDRSALIYTYSTSFPCGLSSRAYDIYLHQLIKSVSPLHTMAHVEVFYVLVPVSMPAQQGATVTLPCQLWAWRVTSVSDNTHCSLPQSPQLRYRRLASSHNLPFILCSIFTNNTI